ncbi:tRNA pseudouridine(38-40) synthase TruA [Paraoerskovia sediminicola]|uniref:tRNA pseudouridine(38-40) synthase TruA n=1 Tax=Paraoerskovia sediminicola TaxID=1138587 RepID=UPI00257223DE|nr:tRNA pseudouridine(38-40) synthase TruA [Paraoerskovia sediminicola]
MDGAHDTVRLRLDLAYDGRAFAGWAVQPGLRTVQGVLEEGIARISRPGRPRVTVAGRTDTGVHARGQVVHVDLPLERWEAMPGRSDRAPGESMVARLAGVLPDDVVVRSAEPAPPGFDARFSAQHRHYTYRIVDDPDLRDPLRRGWTLWARRRLDVDAMHASMQPLLGLRDFAAYCRPRPGATTIRELTRMDWCRVEEGADAGLVVARVSADAFCHNMVRSLVGASLAVGEGRRPVEFPAEHLRGRRRTSDAGRAAAHGLVLEAVDYPPDAELASRARQVRARRMDEDVDED